MMLQAFPPMDFSVDVSLEMQVTKNCALCDQKVSAIMHSIISVYTVTFGETIMKLEARANPNLFMATIQKYNFHGKVNRLQFEGSPVPPQPGEGGYYGQSAYYNAAVNYPYPYAPQQQQFLAGNYGYPMLKPPPPPQKEEAPEGVHKQHTAPPPYAMQPPPPMPLSSYSYVEPPYWPTAPASGSKCVIM